MDFGKNESAIYSISIKSSPEQNRTAIKCLGNIYSIR